MPVVKRKALHGDIQRAIDYVTNPDKTEMELYVSGIECGVSSAGEEMKMTHRKFRQDSLVNTKSKNKYDIPENKNVRVGYHIIQSFALDDTLTPHQAHEIGVRMTKELYPNFEAIVCTHIDKMHLHNHIVINSINKKTGKKLVDKLNDEYGLYKLREKSNEIAKEYNCKIENDKTTITTFKKNNFQYEPSFTREEIVKDLKQCIVDSENYDSCLNLMEQKGYLIKNRNYLSIRHPKSNRYTIMENLSNGEFSKKNIITFYEKLKPQKNDEPLLEFVQEEVFENKLLKENLAKIDKKQKKQEETIDDDYLTSLENLEYEDYYEDDETINTFSTLDDLDKILEESFYEEDNDFFNSQKIEISKNIKDNEYDENNENNENISIIDSVDNVKTDENVKNNINKEKNDFSKLSNYNNNDEKNTEKKGTKKTFTINNSLVVENYLDEDPNNSNKTIEALFVRIPNTKGKYYMYIIKDTERGFKQINDNTFSYDIYSDEVIKIYDKNKNFLKTLTGQQMMDFWDDKTKKIKSSKNNIDIENINSFDDYKKQLKQIYQNKKLTNEEKNEIKELVKQIKERSRIPYRNINKKNRLNIEKIELSPFVNSSNNVEDYKIKENIQLSNNLKNFKEKEIIQSQIKLPYKTFIKIDSMILIGKRERQKFFEMTPQERHEEYQKMKLKDIVNQRNLEDFKDIANDRTKLMQDIEYFSDKSFKYRNIMKEQEEIKRSVTLFIKYYDLYLKAEKQHQDGKQMIDIAYFNELSTFYAAKKHLETKFGIENLNNKEEAKEIYKRISAVKKQYNQSNAIIRSKTNELNLLNDFIIENDISKRNDFVELSFARKRMDATYEQKQTAYIERKNNKINYEIEKQNKLSDAEKRNLDFPIYMQGKAEIILPYLQYTGEFELKDIINRSGEACKLYLEKNRSYELYDDKGNSIYMTGQQIIDKIENIKSKSKIKYKDDKNNNKYKNKYSSKYTKEFEHIQNIQNIQNAQNIQDNEDIDY